MGRILDATIEEIGRSLNRSADRFARAMGILGHGTEQRLAEGPPVYRPHGNAYDQLLELNRLDPYRTSYANLIPNT
jgi:hypothetical protein